MEEREGLLNGSSGVTVEPRVENPDPFPAGSTPTAAPVSTEPPAPAPVPETSGKKKRGRPRKYAVDGSAVALSPMPISASIPLTGDFPAWKQSKARRVDSSKKKHKLDFASAGETKAYSVGGSFIPHVITVNPGEDINMKIISFSQQGSRAICILAANGSISNVTLRQPNSSGGTLTYEGCFEILSLTGSFMPSDNGLTKSRSGGMSVSLAGSDGRVLGGGLAGMLVAAGPVQVVIGSFVPGQQQHHHHQEQKPKKSKYEHTITFGPVSSEERYEGPKRNFSNLAFENSVLHENNVQFPVEDSREPFAMK
ncbi:hypothetical protein ACP275_06G114900 [Erythranthe tilingii]